MSTVSVIIPSYNYAHYLPDCVDSVLSQSGVDVRVLVIDDCSTDNTPEVGAALARDPRVTYRRHEKNQGHIATYNEGIEWLDGDYSALLSADDLLVPGALGRAAAVMDAHPEVGLVYGRSVYFQTNDDRPEPRTRTRGATIWRGHDWIARRCKDGHNVISSPEVVVRTDLQKRLGGYDPDLPYSGDIAMWLRFAAVADIAYIRGADQAFYRVHRNSMTRTRFDAPLADLRQRRAAFDAFFATYGDGLRAHLQPLAHRALAREALWRACRAYDRGRTAADPVDEYVDFALETDPHATWLPVYAGLRWRRTVGPAVCPYLQPLVWTAVAHKARNWLWWQSWKLRGI